MPSAPLVRPHCHDHDPGSATASSKAKHRLSSAAGIQKNHRQHSVARSFSRIKNLPRCYKFWRVWWTCSSVLSGFVAVGQSLHIANIRHLQFPTLGSSQGTNECLSFWSLFEAFRMLSACWRFDDFNPILPASSSIQHWFPLDMNHPAPTCRIQDGPQAVESMDTKIIPA